MRQSTIKDDCPTQVAQEDLQVWGLTAAVIFREKNTTCVQMIKSQDPTELHTQSL